MKLAVATPNENERLQALLEYSILDTPSEQDYEDIVRLASQICQTPVSLVSLSDVDRQWIKAKIGSTVAEMPRATSFCGHAILQYDIFEVADTTQDERFLDSPLVIEENVRFYAGMPLTTPSGFNMGTLCVIDNKPKQLSNEQKFALKTLAHQVITQLELRLHLKSLSKSYQDISQQKEELSEKNKMIIDSINYAQNIQLALLPNRDIIKKAIPEHFIFFKPRDIVSGDFYFFVQQNEHYIFAAVDCTGHGVPGAFMCVMANDFLTHIIVGEKITDPARILHLLDFKVRTALRQHETHNTDGMDITLCSINPTKQTVEVAGAKNSLYYVTQNELKEAKADKLSIGGHETSGKFTVHSLPYNHAVTFYMFTDGYGHQFGGAENRKFMRSKLLNLLLSNSQKSMQEQEHELERVIVEWIGFKRQTDDMLVIGFKLPYPNK